MNLLVGATAHRAHRAHRGGVGGAAPRGRHESGGRTICCSTNMSPPQTGHEGVLLQVSLQGSSHHLLTPPPHPSPHQVMMFPWEDLKSELKKKAKTGSLLPPCQASSVPSVDTTARWGGGGGHQPEKDRERNSVDAPADLMVMCVHGKLKTHVEKQRADTHTHR